MIFKQFYEPSLGHASYLVGSEDNGEALVLDVRRDVDDYFDFAQQQGLKIRYAADTHQHNDYLTGIVQLQSRSSTELLSGARAELGYDTTQFEDGERMQMGEVEFEILHTPGHTPEHISLLVRDHSRGDAPLLLLSGGALLVADVARPDLLGDEAEKRQNARAMCQTLRDKILPLPDYVQVFPTHVAGSLCGGNIGSMLSTTIGYERRLNDMLLSLDRDEEFEQRCLDLGPLPTLPPYWRRMRKQNQQGPALLSAMNVAPALQADEFERYAAQGATIVDCRSPEAFAGAHIPGALNVGAGTSFPTWAGSVLDAERDILLVVDNVEDLDRITWQLLRIGYREPIGWLSGGMQAWRVAAKPLSFMRQMTVEQLDAKRRDSDELVILDVRQPAEWHDGHVPDAQHISGGELPQKLEQIPYDTPIAVYCGSGYRSSVAASLLMEQQHPRIYNVIGGYSAWQAAGLPVES